MAMIELTLRPVPEHEADADEAPESAPAAAIEHTYFVAPVRLTVDGQELLTFPGVYPDWRPLPLLGFSSQLCNTVAGLEDGESGTVTLEDGGFLLITRDGNRLVIATSLTPVSATVPRDEFVSAVANFARAACNYVLSLSPGMAAHPAWTGWCQESL